MITAFATSAAMRSFGVLRAMTRAMLELQIPVPALFLFVPRDKARWVTTPRRWEKAFEPYLNPARASAYATKRCWRPFDPYLNYFAFRDARNVTRVLRHSDHQAGETPDDRTAQLSGCATN